MTRWVDAELVDGPLHGHTTSMLTKDDGVTPRAYRILAPGHPNQPGKWFQYRISGIRLQLPTSGFSYLYTYEA